MSVEASAAAAGIAAVIARERDQFSLEYRCHSPDQKRWFVMRATRFAGTGLGRVVLAHENITSRKLAEEALIASEAELRERESTLRLFVEYSPAAIIMLDNEMRYVAVSRRWMSDYALGERDILGASHYEIFPEVPERWKQIHRRRLAGAVERCDEDPFPRQDASRIDRIRWQARRGGATTTALAESLFSAKTLANAKKPSRACVTARRNSASSPKTCTKFSG